MQVYTVLRLTNRDDTISEVQGVFTSFEKANNYALKKKDEERNRFNLGHNYSHWEIQVDTLDNPEE